MLRVCLLGSKFCFVFFSNSTALTQEIGMIKLTKFLNVPGKSNGKRSQDI